MSNQEGPKYMARRGQKRKKREKQWGDSGKPSPDSYCTSF